VEQAVIAIVNPSGIDPSIAINVSVQGYLHPSPGPSEIGSPSLSPIEEALAKRARPDDGRHPIGEVAFAHD